MVILNPTIIGDTETSINPISTPWINPLMSLFFPSWWGLIIIPASHFPISIIPFLSPQFMLEKIFEGSLSNKYSVFLIPWNSSQEDNNYQIFYLHYLN